MEEKELIKPVTFKEGSIKQEAIVKPVTFKKDPEKKRYLLLYYITDDNDNELKEWEEFTGRKAIYEFIKGIVEKLDIHESRVLVENVDLENAVTVYEFMKHVEPFFDDSFDIEEYNIGDDEI